MFGWLFFSQANGVSRAKKRPGDSLLSPVDKKPRLVEVVPVEDTSSDEDDGPCAAEPCMEPDSDKVVWVQCDQCQKWYHIVCIDLDANYVKRIKTYGCKQCLMVNNTLPSSAQCPNKPQLELSESLLNGSVPVSDGVRMPGSVPKATADGSATVCLSASNGMTAAASSPMQNFAQVQGTS